MNTWAKKVPGGKKWTAQNEGTLHQNACDTIKTMLIGKFITLIVYIVSLMDNLNPYLKIAESKKTTEQTKKKINETKNWI